MLVETAMPCEMMRKPENLAAKTVLSMVEDICWKIKDHVPADKQEEVILKFFQALWSCKNLEDLAAKAVKMITPSNMKKEAEDIEDDDKSDAEKEDGDVEFTLDLYAF